MFFLGREVAAAVLGEKWPVANPAGHVDLNGEVAQDGVGEVEVDAKDAGLLEVHRFAVRHRGGRPAGREEHQPMAEDEVEQASEIVRREMAEAFEMDPPLEVDVGTGQNWLEAK